MYHSYRFIFATLELILIDKANIVHYETVFLINFISFFWNKVQMLNLPVWLLYDIFYIDMKVKACLSSEVEYWYSHFQ